MTGIGRSRIDCVHRAFIHLSYSSSHLTLSLSLSLPPFLSRPWVFETTGARVWSLRVPNGCPECINFFFPSDVDIVGLKRYIRFIGSMRSFIQILFIIYLDLDFHFLYNKMVIFKKVHLNLVVFKWYSIR